MFKESNEGVKVYRCDGCKNLLPAHAMQAFGRCCLCKRSGKFTGSGHISGWETFMFNLRHYLGRFSRETFLPRM